MRVARVGCAVCTLFSACAAESARDPAPRDAGMPAQPALLVDVERFTELAADASDPFDTDAAARAPCTPPAFVVEEDPAGARTLEVRTDVCNFLTLAQPTRVAIERGDTLQLWMWHNTLFAQEPATGQAALSIDGELVWSIEIPIPSAAQSYAPTWRAKRAVPAGKPVLLHVHNHGANAWRFGELTVLSRD